MPRIRAIVFDLDGTLVDSYTPIATSLNAARVHFGLPPMDRDDIRRQVGHGLEDLMECHLGRDRVDEGVRVFRECYREIFLDETRPLPHALDAVVEIGTLDCGVAVASNKPARFSSPILERLGFAPHVAEVLGPDDAIPPKPHPAMLGEAMWRLGTEASETLYVGDMPLDVETAREAGVALRLVPTGGATAEDLRAVGGERVLSDLRQLRTSLFAPEAGLSDFAG